MKILITGGAGFIASHITDLYIENGHEVVIVDNLSRGNKENINKKAKFYEMDITSERLEDVFKAEKPDIVNHHAAMINVRESVEMPLEYEKNNILGLVNVLENCRKYNVKKIINVSSGGVVYGQPENMPPKEDYPFDPESPYGITKVASEYWCRYYQKQFGINFTSMRYANVYGPRQSTEGGAGVVAIFAKLMLKGEQPKIFGDGSIVRDYVNVKDVARANLLALDHADNEGINIGTGNKTTVQDIFDAVREVTNYEGEPKYENEKPGELKVNYLNVSKAKEIMDWQPEVKLVDGVREVVEYFKD